MHIRRRIGLGFRAARRGARDALHVDDVIMRRVELRLGEEGQQAVVAAVPVHDDDLLAAVAGHLVGRLLQQLELQAAAIGNRPRLVLRFEDLAKVIIGEHDGVFLLRGIERDVTHVEQIVPERQMRSVLFQDAEWQETGALRLGDAGLEVRRGQFLPMHRELRRRSGRGLRTQHRGAKHIQGNRERFVHWVLR